MAGENRWRWLAVICHRGVLAAEGKSGKTVRTYAEAVRWFAAAHLLRETSHCDWDQVGAHGLQSWMVWLLRRYSDSSASNQYRALQQFFRWWSDEEELPGPMARLHPPRVGEKLVPVFTSIRLAKLERACRAGGSRSDVITRSSACSGPPVSAI